MRLIRIVALGITLAVGGISPRLRAEITPEDIRQLQTRFQQAEESEERLRARIQKLEATVAELRSQIGDVRSVAASAGKDAVTQEQLRKVLDQLKELDRRRQEDNEKVLQQIKRLADLPAPPPPSFEDPKPRGRKPAGDPGSGGGTGGRRLDPSPRGSPRPSRPNRYFPPTTSSTTTLFVTASPWGRSSTSTTRAMGSRSA